MVASILESKAATLAGVSEEGVAPELQAEDRNSSFVTHHTEDADGRFYSGDADIKAEYYEGWRNRGWLTVLGSFLVVFYLWGVIYSWGVFQVLYVDVYPELEGFTMSFGGPLALTMTCLMGPLAFGVIQRVQSYRCPYIVATVLCPLSLVLASFATQFWMIQVSQGILFGVGGGFVFLVSCVLPAQWFDRNRALAGGITVAGGSLGPVVLAPITQAMIASPSVGYQNALRVLGMIGFVLLGSATCLAWPRFPAKRDPNWWKLVDPAFVTARFGLWLVAFVLMSFGFIAPPMLVPLYAKHIGASRSLGSALVSVMFVGNAVSRTALGYAADRMGAFNTLFVTSLLSGVTTMALWPCSQAAGVYAVYCVLFGVTGGAYLGLAPSCIAQLAGVQHIQKGLAVTYTVATIGLLFGGPISGALLARFSWMAAIQFPGTAWVVSSIAVLVIRLWIDSKLFVKV